jgi:hypothetical protein
VVGVSPTMPHGTRLTSNHPDCFQQKKTNFVANYRGSTRLASDHDFLLGKYWSGWRIRLLIPSTFLLISPGVKCSSRSVHLPKKCK